MASLLTSGVIERIMKNENVSNPVLQVLGHKKISGGSAADRYRLLLSDGKFSHSSAMLATQLNHKVEDGELGQFAIIQLEKFLCNTIQPDRRVMIILELKVLKSGSEVGQKLGSPQTYKPGMTSSSGGGETGTTAPPPKPDINQNRSPAVGNMQSGGQRSQMSAPNTPGGTQSRVYPINSLTPYQNRWTIRVRVTNKSGIRTWSNSKGEGKLFSMNLLDESGEIKATAFTQQVDKYYDMIEVNKVYYISKGTLKTADKRYNSTNNDYEMTFNNDTSMTLCEEDTDLPNVTFNFSPINNLDSVQPNSTIDVIGVVKFADELKTVTGRQSNKEIMKRDVQLVDENKALVNLTLWGNDAEKFDGSSNPVLAVRACRVSDWNGRSLSVLTSSQVLVNPDIPEAHKLRGWYDSEGHCAEFDEYKREGGASGSGGGTNWKTFSQVKGENLGSGEKADYFTTKATIVFMRKENCMYTACPSADCNKKVIDQGNGNYRCEKCQKEYPNFKYRMILSANLADHTDNQWVTCFQETAEAVLGKPADEIGSMREQDEAGFDQLFAEATFKSFTFKLRAKMESYNDETRLKTICVQATPINFKEYNTRLVGEIEKLLSA